MSQQSLFAANAYLPQGWTKMYVCIGTLLVL